MRIILTLLLLIILSSAENINAQTMDKSLNDMNWLMGSWEGTLGGGTSRETWTINDDNNRTGKGEFLKNGTVVFGERLYIQKIDEHIFYVAIPQGQKPVLFNLVNNDLDKKVVFENMEHDFPQRITYTNEGDVIRITLEGKMDGKDGKEEYSLGRK